jgi:hypothetical protein
MLAEKLVNIRCVFTRRSMIRFFMAPLPTRQIRVDECLIVSTQTIERPQHRLQIRFAQVTRSLSLIQRASNLVEVSTHGTDFGNAAFER